jgi:Saf4/Yju2 protein
MGERKVLNKYIPADFDPSLVPRGKKLSKKDGTVPVRMMLPFTIQCSTCHTFLYRGRKFNSKKEPMSGPDGRYLGIQRFRFYIKCTQCSRTLSFLTDPKNADYEMETGGTRNYEVYKDKEKTEEESALEKEEEEKDDPMKALENRVLDSQREMADLDNLAEIQAMNRRHLQLMSSKSKSEDGTGFDDETKALLDAREAAKERQKNASVDQIELNEHGITEAEEALVRSIQFGKKNAASAANGINSGLPYSASSSNSVLRLNEEDEKRAEEKRLKDLVLIQNRQEELDGKSRQDKAAFPPSRPTIKIKKRKKASGSVVDGGKKATVQEASITAKKPKQDLKTAPRKETPSSQPSTNTENGLASLLGAYGSDSDSD